ncbi:MAG: hypothetical protein WD939_05590 [Dehalococcoidia bacterium]
MKDRGPFDHILQSEALQRPDLAATIVVGLGILLGIIMLVLVLPPVSIFDEGGGSSITGPVTFTTRDELPAPPAGYEAVSALFELDDSEPVGAGARPRLTVNLSSRVSEGDVLVMFTYRGDEWQRLGEAVPVAGGDSAQAELAILPENVAVFRPVERIRMVVGTVPAGEDVDALALDAITTLNVTGLAPAADGGLTGGRLEIGDVSVDIAPTISTTTTAQARNLNDILLDPELRDAHVRALVELAGDEGFAGIDLDYRSVDASNGDDFVVFVEQLSSELRSAGLGLTLTLPLPVQGADGWDTLGYDWEALAPLVDALKLPPDIERDGYYERMEAVLGFLTSRVSSGKLLLSVSPLSYERGVDGVRELTLTEALALASTPVTEPEGTAGTGEEVRVIALNLAGETGATGMRWDEASRSVAFGYTGPGGARIVWLGNMFSEAFRIELADRFELGGVVVADVSERTAAANIWPVVQRFAQTGDVQLVKPNGDLLQPRWQVSDGELQGSAGTAVTWVTPDQDGTYTVTLIVSDGVTRIGQELRVPVRASAGGSASAP